MGDALIEAAVWALVHFEAMDCANAAIHCAPVRYSPVTFRLAMALAAYWPEGEEHTEAMQRVLAHAGQYEEDPGR